MLNWRTTDGVVHLMKYGGKDDGHDETECGLLLVTSPIDVRQHAVLTDRKVTCVTCLANEGQAWRTPR